MKSNIIHTTDELLNCMASPGPVTIMVESDWKSSDTEIREQQLMDWIVEVYTSVKGIYGYRRMTIY